MNTATDDHRYIITAPWGDRAYADTPSEALTARRQLAQDGHDHGHPLVRIEDVTIIDRGYLPLAA